MKWLVESQSKMELIRNRCTRSGSNKLITKNASKFKKLDGLTVVRLEDALESH